MAQATRALRKGTECYGIEIQQVPTPDPIPPQDTPPPTVNTDPTPEDEPKQPSAKRRKTSNKDPPTKEQLEKDVRAAIANLKNSVQQDTQQPSPPDPEYEQKSAWLTEEINLKIHKIGDKVFRTDLPSIRNVGEHVEAIPTIPGAKPPARGIGRYSKVEREELQKHIDELLKQGLIEPSLSPYAAAALVVPKYRPDGSVKGWRLVIDYRMLNTITVKFQFPMPRIDDVMDSLNGAMFYSSCDATHGFWQLQLHPSDIPKTAFRTPACLYQWRVSPFWPNRVSFMHFNGFWHLIDHPINRD
jgi:hypothetical protein